MRSPLASPLEGVNCIGFDMDHTLVRYNIPMFYKLVLKCFVNYLVSEENWDPEILKFEVKAEYAAKGLVIDLEKGNVLNLDSNRNVLKATHGLRTLTAQEVQNLYPDPVEHFDGVPPDRFFTATSYFEAAPCALYLHLVAMQDQEKGPAEDYWDLSMTLLAGYSHFMGTCKDQGSYWPEIKANTSKYIRKPSKELLDGLQHLKDCGVKLFLITNSSPDYTDTVMRYAYGDRFHDLFDVVIVNAKKPYFFNSELPFQEYGTYLATEGSVLEDGLNLELKPMPVIGGGNANDLVESVTKLLNMESVGKVLDKIKCCFVGDNILTDVVAPKSVNWTTVAIVEELDHLYNNTDSYNKIWGSFFSNKTNNGDNKQTLWSNLIRHNADFCCESVDDLLGIRFSPAAPVHVDEIALSPCIVYSSKCKGTKLLNRF